jgi:hypothetical protein
VTKQIPLTQGQVALVDDHWFDYLNQWGWRARWDDHTKSFYAIRRGIISKARMHRMVAKTPDGMLCDHVDGNTLNNQEYNLRNVTIAQNNINKGVYSNNALGVKCIRRRSFGYDVNIKRNGVSHYAHADTLEEAISIRDKMMKELHGEFARYG